jgi:hypothetical protein
VDGVTYAGGMTSDSDDALTWDGDDGEAASSARPRARRAGEAAPSAEAAGDEPTPDVRPAVAAEPPAVPDASSAPAPASVLEHADDESEAEPAGLSTAMLLTVGVIGGVYLLYSVGWVIGGLRLKPLANLIVADEMYLPWFFLAVAAPLLWFLASWILTRGRAAWIRVLALILGVILLVPWPFVTVGVIGS